jgi:hypothetical protein
VIPRQRGQVTTLALRKPDVVPTDYFGPRPDVDGSFVMIEHPVPVGENCGACEGEIAAADRGYLDVSMLTGELKPVHLECDVLLHVGWDGVESDGTMRDAARAALDYVNGCRARIGLGPL